MWFSLAIGGLGIKLILGGNIKRIISAKTTLEAVGEDSRTLAFSDHIGNEFYEIHCGKQEQVNSTDNKELPRIRVCSYYVGRKHT